MAVRHAGNIQPGLDFEEHDGLQSAKRVVLQASNATIFAVVNTGASGGGNVTVTQTNSVDASPATQNITTQDLSSSSATGANGQSVIIGTPTAGSAASFTLPGYTTVRVEVTGIWTGTLASEVSIDGGTTWVGLGLHQGAYTVSTFTAGFVGGGNVAGATNYRIRATAAITGTAIVRITESINLQSVYIANAAPSGNVISTVNSSTVTLGGGAVFTGISEDVSNFSEMRITVFSNVASATDGFSVQQSSDNSNWDIVDTYTISAGVGKTVVVPRQAKWFRIVYTNGAGAQASFRLSSLLNRMGTAPSSQRASDAYTNETDLEQNQAFLMLYNGTTWDRSRGDITNGLDVDVTRLSNVTLNPSSNFIGLTTVVSGAGDRFIGLVTTSPTGLVTLAPSPNFIGLVTIAGMSDPKNYVGLMTVTNGIGDRFIGLVTTVMGSNVTLNASSAQIGFVTINGMIDPKTYVGLNTVTLGVGDRFVGLVTAVMSGNITVLTRNAGTNKTLKILPILLSTNSAATVAVPSNTFYITSILLSSNATVRVNVRSGATYLTGNASLGINLFPGGGFAETGSVDAPIYFGLAAAAPIVIEKADASGIISQIGGKVVYFDE